MEFDENLYENVQVYMHKFQDSIAFGELIFKNVPGVLKLLLLSRE